VAQHREGAIREVAELGDAAAELLRAREGGRPQEAGLLGAEGAADAADGVLGIDLLVLLGVLLLLVLLVGVLLLALFLRVLL